MYQGVNKGGGGVVASAADFSGDLELIPATEAFDSTSGNEGIICQDPDNPNSIIVAQAVLNDVGSLSWIRGDTEKALRRTVSMSQMTSMLRDSERNNVFDVAIKILIDNFLIKVGRAPVALDIGTGTGLLAMLCGRHGAAHVFACEMFDKMAQIAQENVISNDFTEIITIIPCKSSDIEYLPIPADIIVSELLDSALLGEAVIPAHSDAIGRLINEELDGIILPISERVIPSSATISCALVYSPEVNSMRGVSAIGYGCFSPYRSETSSQCCGGSPPIPLHWEQTERRGGKKMSGSGSIAGFRFYEKEIDDIPSQIYKVELIVSEVGPVSGLLLWWDCYLLPESLDPARQYKYSTAPGVQMWQDHWVQIVHPFDKDVECRPGDTVCVTLKSDTVSLSICSVTFSSSGIKKDDKKSTSICGEKRRLPDDTNSDENKNNEEDSNDNDSAVMVDDDDGMDEASPCCTCGWHMLCGPERLQMLNDCEVFAKWRRAFAEMSMNIGSELKSESDLGTLHGLDVGDGSVLSLILAAVARQYSLDMTIISMERKQFSSIFFSQLVNANNYSEKILFIDELSDVKDALLGEDRDSESPSEGAAASLSVLFCECFFYQLNSQPVWQALSYLYMRNNLQPFISPKTYIIPLRARIMCVALELPDLCRNHGFIHSVLGFDHSSFDAVQEEWHEHDYPYRIGDYSYSALSEPTELAVIDYVSPLNKDSPTYLNETIIRFNKAGNCDAVAIWVDLDLTASGLQLRGMEEGNFKYYAKVSIRYFQERIGIEQSKSNHGAVPAQLLFNKIIRCNSEFTYGSSDFNLNFAVL